MTNIHHIINDGWSVGILHNEWITLYNSYSKGKADSLPALALQYKDYTEWHNGLVEKGAFAKAEKYWLHKLADKPKGVALPLDAARKPLQTFNGNRVSFVIDQEQTAALHALGLQQEATLFMTLLTLISVLLHKYSAQKDITIGAPIAGRSREELYPIVGFLVNTLVYRVGIDPGENINELLRKVKQEALESFENQHYPFDVLMDRLDMDRDMSQSPLFNVMLAHNNTDLRDYGLEMNGLKVSPYAGQDDFNMSKFDLIFFMDEVDEKIEVRVEYNSDLFNHTTIERLANNFKRLIQESLDTPEKTHWRTALYR